uniref:Uncharacterized protein n=1 Tax=Anguilla anguilla TaxID=7936 RepID=A0A0E9UFJ5_ANGAN
MCFQYKQDCWYRKKLTLHNVFKINTSLKTRLWGR